MNWFQDLGFGLFIHWNVDATLGAVISHFWSGSSDEYAAKYVNVLRKFFNPKKIGPDKWASLDKLAGMEYMVFTAKHHTGFCMWDTKTTDFSEMKTPFGRDTLKELLAAFRKQGIAVGLYFSPDDFHYRTRTIYRGNSGAIGRYCKAEVENYSGFEKNTQLQFA